MSVEQNTWLFVLAVGALSSPSCATDTLAEGPDGPCTRTADCQGGLICGLKGFCTVPDASDADQVADARPMLGGDADESGASDAIRGD
jgi:hypothetical protein